MTKISYNKIARAIYETSRDKRGGELAGTSKNVVSFLARRRLLSKTPEILDRLQKIVDEENGVVRAKVTSERELRDATKRDIKHSLKKRYGAEEMVLEENVDEKLLGGFKIEAKDDLLDLTTRNKINKLKEHLTS